MSAIEHVFVYGTLRAGEVNDLRTAAARHALPDPVLIGNAAVQGRLYDFGSYPGLVLDEQGATVQGEVWCIDARLVLVLDEIEEVYPDEAGLFASERKAILCDGRLLDCLIYPVDARAAASRPAIASGDWIAWRCARSGS